MSRAEHLKHLEAALRRGEQALAKRCEGLDYAECSALEYWDREYHELRRKQMARAAQYIRLTTQAPATESQALDLMLALRKANK